MSVSIESVKRALTISVHVDALKHCPAWNRSLCYSVMMPEIRLNRENHSLFPKDCWACRNSIAKKRIHSRLLLIKRLIKGSCKERTVLTIRQQTLETTTIVSTKKSNRRKPTSEASPWTRSKNWVLQSVIVKRPSADKPKSTKSANYWKTTKGRQDRINQIR